MRAIALMLIFLALFAPQVIRPEVLEIPLLQATGIYSEDGTFSRIDSFQLDQLPTHINSAWILLSGDFTSGHVVCSGDTFPSGALFSAQMYASPGAGYWVAYFGIEGGTSAFLETASFRSHSGATWDFLLDGRSQITIGFNLGAGNPVCEIFQRPCAIVNEASLFIDADFPIPTDNYTWGLIKELFKN